MIWVTKGDMAEVPKRYLSDRKPAHTGEPEVTHPARFWEAIDIVKRTRETNMKGFYPIRSYGRFRGLEGFDFDEPLQADVINALLFLLHTGQNIYWRPSTTARGIHIMAPKGSLSAYDDQARRIATELRGYEWFWEIKDGHRSFEWQRIRTQMDIIKLLNYQQRKHRRERT